MGQTRVPSAAAGHGVTTNTVSLLYYASSFPSPSAIISTDVNGFPGAMTQTLFSAVPEHCSPWPSQASLITLVGISSELDEGVLSNTQVDNLSSTHIPMSPTSSWWSGSIFPAKMVIPYLDNWSQDTRSQKCLVSSYTLQFNWTLMFPSRIFLPLETRVSTPEEPRVLCKQ